MKSTIRSPFFYVGDKYKLMPQLLKLFPSNINTYYEPFVGGGSSFLNVKANKYMLNDINKDLIKLHTYFKSFSNNNDMLFKNLFFEINKYGLSCSYLNKNVPNELKDEYKKTYFAKYNKNNYINMRNDYNQDKSKLELLYLLIVYGFNHMIRFNSKGDFNLPVGNVDFNKNVFNAINNYLDFTNKINISFSSLDYKEFLTTINFIENDFIYFDPPYLISNSEYNKFWGEDEEIILYNLIDKLDKNNIKFGLSNIVKHKGKENSHLKKWMNKYYVFEINSNYISRFDNSIKNGSKEVYITNYGKN